MSDFETETEMEEKPKRKRGRKPKDPSAEPVEKKERPRHPLPDGWLTPTDLFHYLSFYNISDASNQQCYVWAKSNFPAQRFDKDKNPILDDDGNAVMTESNGFPSAYHTDGRLIVDRDASIEWIKNYEQQLNDRKLRAREREMTANTRLVTAAARLGLMHAKRSRVLRDSVTLVEAD